MIIEVKQYLMDSGIPKIDDIVACVKVAQEHNCAVQLNWEGPGYKWHGDTYKCIVYPDSDANTIYDSLPKSYGL